MVGIYKITNLINNKIYIGQSVDIKERWQEHKRINERQNENAKIMQQYPLYKAFKKYGLNNFLFEVIEECLITELDDKEIFWIKYYNSYIGFENSNGYNLTTGGKGNRKVTEEQISLIISLWQEGKSTGEIMSEVGIERHAIIKYLKIFCPTYSAEEGDKRGREINGKKHQKSIKQYDLFGNFIKEYSSIKEAVKDTGICIDSIIKNLNYKSKVCKNLFYFIYSSDNQEEALLKHKNMEGNNKPVVQLDFKNNILNVFPSATAAAKALGKKPGNISSCCRGNSNSAYGYMWKYV